MFATEHSRWQAVQSRSKSADSAFVYAVTTTRICCRPTCPARLARRANVRFYDTSIQAVAAGFRPCKRCKPDQAHLDDSDGAASQKLAVQKARSYIEAKGGDTTLKDIAKHTGISARYLHGIFKDITGTTPAAYAARFKTATTNTPATSQDSVPQTPNSGYFGHRPDAIIGDSAAAIDDVDLDYYTSAASYAAVEGQLKSVGELPEDLGWTLDVDLPSGWEDSYGELSGYCTEVDFVESCTPPDPPSFTTMLPDSVFLDPEFNWNECWPDLGMEQPVLV